jgi:hypothetical protein
LPVDTSTAMAEAKPIMAARPSHTPPPCFAPCSHRTESDVAALEEAPLLLDLGAEREPWMKDDAGREDSAAGEAPRTEKSAMTPTCLLCPSSSDLIPSSLFCSSGGRQPKRRGRLGVEGTLSYSCPTRFAKICQRA